MPNRLHSLFAYGTLIFEDIMRMVVGRTFPSQPACVQDHARYLVAGEVYPALVGNPGSRVDGLLYHGLDDDAIALLDRFEGDFYDRVEVTVVDEDGDAHPALTYRVKSQHVHRLTQDSWDPVKFDREKRRVFIEGYRGFARI